MARWDAAWHRRLRQIIAELPDKDPEEAAEIRRELGRHDVIAFAILYLEHHLRSRDTGDQVTFAECHYEWALMAESWRDPVTEPMQFRDAYIAPRSTGKSTWFFLIIPLWAAAYNYVRFCAAFSQASSQAVGHLQTMRGEMDANALLQADFPLLCAPARMRSGSTVADRQGMIHTASGFTFAARGMDSAVLGLKVDQVRPEVLIVDDPEPDGSLYSPGQAEKRLRTLIDAIFALNTYARVVIVGTVTMVGSITHQLVRSNMGDPPDPDWVSEEKINIHHHRAILANDDGTERSIWPEKWSTKWLISRRHTMEFQKNYENDPRAVAGDYWTADDFRYGTLGNLATQWVLQVDPAVTTKGSSDWTGLAVVARRPPLHLDARKTAGRDLDAVMQEAAEVAWRDGLPEWMDPFEDQCEVVWAGQVKLAGEKLRAAVMKILTRFPKITRLRVETNQGGETWRTIFHDLPQGVRLLEHTSSVSKEARFASALTRWHEHRVIHRERIIVLEDQMTGFPKMDHDDVADAVTNIVLVFLPEERKPRRNRAVVESYV